MDGDKIVLQGRNGTRWSSKSTRPKEPERHEQETYILKI